MCLFIRCVAGLEINMTANKSSKAVARAGDGKAAREIPDRSVTSGTEKGHSGGGGVLSIFTLYGTLDLSALCLLLFVTRESFTWSWILDILDLHRCEYGDVKLVFTCRELPTVLSIDENQSCTKFLLFCHVYNPSITYTLFTLRKNSNHSSIKRTVVHLTSAPLDRTTVIVVCDACNSCALALFTFEADELKMFCRFLGFAAWSARVWRQAGISF